MRSGIADLKRKSNPYNSFLRIADLSNEQAVP